MERSIIRTVRPNVRAVSDVRNLHAAFLLPRGEKDRLRGFGRWSLILKLPNPSPRPLPSGERETTIVADVTFSLT